MHPNDEAWIVWRETLGIPREESIKTLRDYEAMIRYMTSDGTAQQQEAPK